MHIMWKQNRIRFILQWIYSLFFRKSAHKEDDTYCFYENKYSLDTKNLKSLLTKIPGASHTALEYTTEFKLADRELVFGTTNGNAVYKPQIFVGFNK